MAGACSCSPVWEMGGKGVGFGMSRTFHHGDRRIRVRGIRRAQPDIPKLARALIELAQAQAEAEARAEHQARAKKDPRARSRRRGRRG